MIRQIPRDLMSLRQDRDNITHCEDLPDYTSGGNLKGINSYIHVVDRQDQNISHASPLS